MLLYLHVFYNYMEHLLKHPVAIKCGSYIVNPLIDSHYFYAYQFM